MSSIFGILRRDGQSVSEGSIDRMTSILSTRSPDGFTGWRQAGVMLGQGHLRVDTRTGCAAGVVETNNHVLVADTRLDDTAALIRRLELHATATAEDILLAAYRRWREDCVQYLSGDFAFAIWDRQAATLFCARDHLGARPVYFTDQPDFFALASSPEALVALPSVSAAPYADRIASCFNGPLLAKEHDRTWHREVIAIMAGECLTLTLPGKPEKRVYWTLQQDSELRLDSEQAYVEAFREKMGAAVARRTRNNSNALLLSGGMDSAAVLMALMQEPPGNLSSYSVVSNRSASCIESDAIRLLQQQVPGGHITTREIGSDPGMLHTLRELAWCHSHPVDNSILLQGLLANSAAGSQRVLLHGTAGDVVQTHSTALPALLLQQGQWRAAWQECRDISARHTYAWDRSAQHHLMHNGWRAFAPLRIKQLRSQTGRWRQRGQPRTTPFSEDFVRRLRLRERLRQQAALPPGRHTLQNPHWIDTDAMMRQVQSSSTALDRVAGRVGMTGRDAWGDKDLVEFYCSLPLDIRTRHGWIKYLARQACRQDLPAMVCDRYDKTHLGWKLTDLLVRTNTADTHARLRSVMENLAPYIDASELARLQANPGIAPDDLDLVLELLTLGYWLEQSGE